MSFAYNEFKRALARGEIDLQSDDIRAMLVMSNTTADTEDDANTISDFSTLDECDGANYARQALANEAVNEDAANDRAEFDADNVVFSSLGAGTRQNVGLVVYKHVTNDADSVPLFYIDTGGFPFDASGSDVTIQWNTEGIAQIA